jgi:hypothetical protein
MRKLLVVLILAVLCVPAFSQSAGGVHYIKRLNVTGTSFYRPVLKNEQNLRDMFQLKKAEIAAVLKQAGWQGNVDDLANAIRTGTINTVDIQPGTHLPFMVYRHRGKPAVLVNVVWSGKESFSAFQTEFDSNGVTYRFSIAKPCGNFWIEEVAKQAPPPPATPSVSLQGADVCITQPARVSVTVQNGNGATIDLAVDGKSVNSFPATEGTSQQDIPAFSQPGSHTVTASLSGASPASATINVRPCPPTCALTVNTSVPPGEGGVVMAKAGGPIVVDMSGSNVAQGINGGIKSANVEIIKDGKTVDTFQLTAPDLRRADVKLKGAGVYTIRGTVTDASGQTSTNACEASVTATGQPLFFVAGFFGKERLVQDETQTVTITNPDGTTSTTDVVVQNGRCAPIIGVKAGITPTFNDHLGAELAAGGKINTRDTGNSSIFIDAALQGLFEKGFIGGGVSFWDLTESDTRAAALLVQFGLDITKSKNVQFVVEGRAPFDKFDDLSNNYMFWGGIRIRLAK